MLPSEELAILHKKQTIAIEEEVLNLYRRFIKVSPVAKVNGGSFRADWAIEQNHGTSWTISNNVEYATILFDGRRPVAGRWYGSKQWVEGGEIMLKRFNRALDRRLKKIKV